MQRLWELFDYRDGNLYKKQGSKKGIPVGSKSGRVDKYLDVMVGGKRLRAHRVIYCMFYGSFPRVVDHINGNTLDNRIDNLRAATISENAWNAKLAKTNTSGIKGVSWHRVASKWVASVGYKNKLIYLGLHKTIQQAEQAVQQTRLQLHGEFARHI